MSSETPSTDESINRYVRLQHGVVHRRQLLGDGATYRQLEGRLAAGSLIELAHGSYTVPSAPATWLRQYKAAELAIPGAAVGGLAAAKLLDLRATTSAAPEIVVAASTSSRCRLARVHRRKDVLLTQVQGIRVTNAPQTLVDIADRLRLVRIEEVWTGALIRRRTTLDAIAERVDAARSQRLSHRGTAAALLESLTDGVDLAESELEELLFRLASVVPGANPVRQMALPWWKEGRGRGDVGIPAWRVILEADGRSWHARLRDFDADRMRDNVAVANGYVVLRFGAVHLQRCPEDVVELIEAVGRHRRAA